MTNNNPYSTRLLMTKIELPTLTTSGGALLSSGDVPLGEKGRVVKAGENCVNCKEGTIVSWYPPTKAKEIYLDGVKYLTMFESEIWFYDNSQVNEAVDKSL